MKIKLYGENISSVNKTELRDRFLAWCDRQAPQHLEATGTHGALCEFVSSQLGSRLAEEDANELTLEFRSRFWALVISKPYWTIYERAKL